ncbi:hypothetical protein KHQ08_12655 [Pseudochrobactrum algeriensis]|uniref:hypothetical protein n=1 Tax=Pseudochrobactrum algeriensis TaxID=2834768 RepID=UPI001BD0658E|nr:hypothetical protein [Pseudochrobactrum algeriensis]QVQ36028.1 hypothetical protein KHQ08_12655 [Pseudochrobactrum algeriensis]QVQ39245.1 hypothetical protein KHQ07_10940 [Pseudochrobactrum algeriensis]QVQ43165.1 hypothetical protein KHQ09_12900 [Pseudochrobactrum algeriensis]
MEKRKRRQKSCWEIALVRACQARRQKKHPILIGWAFIATLLSLRTLVMQPSMPQQSDVDNDWPISDYERGYTTSPKPRRERYSEQPSMKRLMRDLRRPSAREIAMQFLLARIDDVALRGWIIDQIHQERINRLAVHVRLGMHDAKVIASWQAECDAEKTTANEAINEALTNVPSIQT